MTTHIRFIVDGQGINAVLDTEAGEDFAQLLPLALTLQDYHGIEKIADLPRALNTQSAPSSYKPSAGDITVYAPWGNLALFYKPFPESRGLVRLGEFTGDYSALTRSREVEVQIELAE